MLLPKNLLPTPRSLVWLNASLLICAWGFQLTGVQFGPIHPVQPWPLLALMTVISLILSGLRRPTHPALMADCQLIYLSEISLLCLIPVVFTENAWFGNAGILGTILLLSGLRSAHAPTDQLLGLLVWIKVPVYQPRPVQNYHHLNTVIARWLVPIGWLLQITATVSLTFEAISVLFSLLIIGILIWRLA